MHSEELKDFQSDVHFSAGTERNVLSCVMKSQEAWISASYGITSEDFTIPLNQILWITIDSLRSKGAVVDPVVLYDALPKQYKEELDDLGGWAYVRTLLELPIDPNNINFEICKLQEYSFRRRVDAAGSKLQEVSREKKTLDQVKEDVEATFNDIEKESDEEVVNIGSNALSFIEKRVANAKEVPGLPTGFETLDVVVQGLQEGKLYVVGAPQKTGKSMLLLNWAKHIVLDLGLPVLWISTEHSQDDEFSRLLSLETQIAERSINNGTFTLIDSYADAVPKAIGKIQQAPFNFVSMPLFTLEKIKRVTRYMTRVHGIKVLFFDFIKTNESGADKEWMQLGILAYGLKSLAMQEGIAVVTACQMNRDGKQNFKMTGEMDSNYFAGSDRISHALSVGFVLRPPTSKESNHPEHFRVLQISDNRHGPSGGRWLLDFLGETITMRENKRL